MPLAPTSSKSTLSTKRRRRRRRLQLTIDASRSVFECNNISEWLITLTTYARPNLAPNYSKTTISMKKMMMIVYYAHSFRSTPLPNVAPTYSKTKTTISRRCHDGLLRSQLTVNVSPQSSSNIFENISIMMMIVYYDQRHSQSSSNWFKNGNINEEWWRLHPLN